MKNPVKNPRSAVLIVGNLPSANISPAITQIPADMGSSVLTRLEIVLAFYRNFKSEIVMRHHFDLLNTHKLIRFFIIQSLIKLKLT